MESYSGVNLKARAVDYSLPARRVIRLLAQLVERYGKPERLQSDNGPEFISQALQDWCKDQSIELCWIEPGKPTQNAYIERFNAGPPVRDFSPGGFRCPYFYEYPPSTSNGGGLASGVQHGAASSGFEVYDAHRVPTGSLNSSQNWLTKRGKDRVSWSIK